VPAYEIFSLKRWPFSLGAGLLLTALFCAPAAATEADLRRADSWTFSFYFENDMFAGTDRNYTNGTKLTWISPDLTSYASSDRLPKWFLPYVKRLPFINEPGLKRNLAFAIGQNMYTPRDISRRELTVDDRPYSGWTYGAVAFHSKNSRRLDSMELQLGMVGPLSFAEQTQDLVHKLRGLQRPQGWDHQLDNEPGLEMIYERKLRLWQIASLSGLGADAIGHLGAALGNVAIYANSGLCLRLGWNIPVDFGTSLIRPAGDTNAPLDSRDTRLSSSARFGVHLFSTLDGRAVARDIFVDGNSFADSHRVAKEHFVADAAAGISLLLYNFKLSYAQALRTREFECQDKYHSFGSITMSFSY